MNKLIFCFLFLFLPFILFSKPYYSEFHEDAQGRKQFIVVFHGNILEELVPKVKILEIKFLEYENGKFLDAKHLRWELEKELNELGIRVEIFENTDKRRAKKTPNSSE